MTFTFNEQRHPVAPPPEHRCFYCGQVIPRGSGSMWTDRTTQGRRPRFMCVRCSKGAEIEPLFEGMRADGYGLEYACLD